MGKLFCSYVQYYANWVALCELVPCLLVGYGEAAGEGYAGASAESGGAAADYGGVFRFRFRLLHSQEHVVLIPPAQRACVLLCRLISLRR